MSGHPVFDEIEHARLAAAREWHSIEEHVADVLHHQTPATRPATMKAATAAAQQEENPVSLATLEADLGDRVAAAEAAAHAAVHNEIGKLIADLPALTAEAKQLAGNPFAEVALKAAEHLAAGVLPVDAIATVAGNAMKWLADLAALYNPQGAQQAPAAPVAAPVQ